MKNNLELTDDQLILVERALDLYTRVGLGQFWYLDLCHTLQKNIDKLSDEDKEHFRIAARILSKEYTHMSGDGQASYGIFNDAVGKDVKLAAHLNQAIAHHRWLNNSDRNENIHCTAASPADIWKIAYDELLEIKISNLE
jgi:hypothetical protein